MTNCGGAGAQFRQLQGVGPGSLQCAEVRLITHISVQVKPARLPNVERDEFCDRPGQHSLAVRVDDVERGRRSCNRAGFPTDHPYFGRFQRRITELIDFGEFTVVGLGSGRHNIHGGDVEDTMILVSADGCQLNLPDVGKINRRFGGYKRRAGDINVLPSIGGGGDVAVEQDSRCLRAAGVPIRRVSGVPADLHIHVPVAVGWNMAPKKAQVKDWIGPGAKPVERIEGDFEDNIPGTGRINRVDDHCGNAIYIGDRKGTADVGNGR